jgi:hypothetical protein
MQPYEAAQALKTFRTKSVTRYEVKTLPPTTAAFPEGFKKHPSGIWQVIGFKQP